MADTINPNELQDLLAAGNVTLLDVRRRADRDAAPQGIPGATWKDPELVENWGDELPREKPVVIYCVRGGSVSSSVQSSLRGKNLDVTFVAGGLAAWDVSK